MTTLFELPPAKTPANLLAMRQREERCHAELLQLAAAALADAWCMSVHHIWLEDLQEFLDQEDNRWWTYGSEATRLEINLESLRKEGCRLFIQEEEAVQSVATKLNEYSKILKTVNRLELARVNNPK